jgi:peptidoglycan/LPS O-acetylase OafA/YrhL
MPTAISTPIDQHSATALAAAATATSTKGQRIPALDFTKGTLVLLMVLYHWVNYFIELPSKYYDYLRFLTPSFIFITGFMISHVYLSKYAPTDSRLAKRLCTRGLKLTGVFLALNVARAFIVPMLGTGFTSYNIPSLSNVFAVFVSGNFPVVGGKLISFSILVPISYLLILSGILMVPYRRHKYTFHFTCLCCLSCIAGLYLLGLRSYNLEFITFGLFGVLIGFMPISVINALGRHPYGLAAAYVSYLIAITIWSIPFLLLAVGVSLNLIVIYLVGDSDNLTGFVRRETILLGKYSLLGYISQIAILQLLSVSLRRFNLGLLSLAVSFVVAVGLTILSVEAVDRARERAVSVDRLYKAIFA